MGEGGGRKYTNNTPIDFGLIHYSAVVKRSMFPWALWKKIVHNGMKFAELAYFDAYHYRESVPELLCDLGW